MPAVNTLAPVLASLLCCVEENLSEPVGRALVMPGNTVVWDDCCDGQLWVRIVSLVGSSAMSTPAKQPCVPLYQCRVGIGVVRCAHTVDDHGMAPTPAEMTADSFATYQDSLDVIQAVNCCFAEQEIVQTLRIEQWLPVGPQGGCVGGEVSITFNVNLCQPCPEYIAPTQVGAE